VSLLLLGGTDLTLAVAERARDVGVDVGGLVYVGHIFDISYAARGSVSNVRAAPLEAWCAQHGVEAHRYEGAAELERFVAAGAYDVGLAAGWYHMIPRAVRERFPRGCIGVHASLLPRLRGGAPLNWALLAGERETGVTLFELGDGVDDGPIYGQRSFRIGERATIGELVEQAERATLEVIDEVLPRLLRGEIEPVPQTGTPSYALQRTPVDGRIDWRRPAVELDVLVRAVGRPYPGARTRFDGEELIVWAAEPLDSSLRVLGMPGQVARIPEEADPCVVTGEGALVLRDVTDAVGAPRLEQLRRAANRRFDDDSTSA